MKTAATAAIFLCLGVAAGWTGSSWTKSNRPSMDQETAQAATPTAKPGSTAWLIEQFQKDINEGYGKRRQEVKSKEEIATTGNNKQQGCIGYRETQFTLSNQKEPMLIANCKNSLGWYLMVMPDVIDK